MTGYIYDSAFQNMASTGSAYAARLTVGAISGALPVRSVIDLGCARGTWLREWRKQAVDEILGVDGDYVDVRKLEIDRACFHVHDLAKPFRHSRRYDLAQSLEVAEHLPPARAASFVDDLVDLAPVVLFSAATPGQGGEHHVNEQPVEYWRRLFLARDYVALDWLRPLLARQRRAPAWYRYNMLFYVRRDRLESMPEALRVFELPDDTPARDPSPPIYRLRKQIVRALPRELHDHLARLNARRFGTGA